MNIQNYIHADKTETYVIVNKAVEKLRYINTKRQIVILITHKHGVEEQAKTRLNFLRIDPETYRCIYRNKNKIPLDLEQVGSRSKFREGSFLKLTVRQKQVAALTEYRKEA